MTTNKKNIELIRNLICDYYPKDSDIADLFIQQIVSLFSLANIKISKSNFPFIKLFLTNNNVSIITSTENKILLVNFAFLKFYNYEFSKIIYKNIDELIYKCKDSRDNKPIYLNNNNHFYIKHQTNNNIVKYVECFITPMLINEFELLFYNIIDCSDENLIIHELKNTNQQLTSVNARLADQLIEAKSLNNKFLETERDLLEMISKKDRFVSIFSHDLKNYIQTIKDNSSMLNNIVLDKNYSIISEMSNSLNQSIGNLYGLLENLLDWSKIQTGKINIVINDYDLCEIVDNNILLFDYYSKSKNIIIINEIPQQFKVKTDLNIINIILRNLISNAIKYSYPNNEIFIKLHSSNEKFAQVVVSDNGIGIDINLQKIIFDLRYVIKTPGTYNEKGSGIGLILIKELLNGMGLDIWFESKPNYGSNFYFSIKR